MAGVAPAGSEETGGEAIGVGSASITFSLVLILALDTTTRAGSAAIVRDGAVLLEHAGDPAITHGQRLPRDLMRLLDEAGVRLADVDVFAVAAGPGSFTGLRVGIATVQGLAVGAGRRVVPVPTLEALARAGRNGVHRVAPWMDAQRGEVFAAIYAADGASVNVEASSESPEGTLARWQPALAGEPLRFVGDGALRYREVVERTAPAAIIVDPLPPLAGFVGIVASESPQRAVLPHAVVPVYVRRSDAELARARRNAERC
jgi:tRNA threonylcarbamoyladenosine biosynthesis protein TsaB